MKLAGRSISFVDSSRRGGHMPVLRAALGTILLTSGIAVADSCKAINGTISALQPATCSASQLALVPPPIACFQGTFKGDLTGTYKSGLTNVQPVVDQPGTITFGVRSDLIVAKPSATISTVDAGVGTGCRLIGGQFVCPFASEVLVMHSGTKAFSDARALIVLSGGYLWGQPGVYQGVLCRQDRGGKDDD
jgi:hypothetical protein